ncbi:MAG TPA: flagellar basal body-associated FliL family protein [Bdellovibrionota bacterium]|jgi:flagellar basal body-associated protein FliL
MPNLSVLKDKLSALKAKLVEKTNQIGFIRARREKAQETETKAQDPHSLAAIYREGGVLTRLQVIAFYIFVLVALVSAGSLIKKVAGKIRSSDANEQLKQDYSNEFAEARRKALEKVDLLSLGQFTTNVYVGPPQGTMMMNIDLWVRVNDPDAAAMINNKGAMFHDKTLDALNDLFVGKVNLLSEEGKLKARERIRAALNTLLKKGQVEDVFIHNLVAQ